MRRSSAARASSQRHKFRCVRFVARTVTPMASINVTLSVKRAWWVMPYIFGVQLFSELTGMQPDMGKVSATVRRGFKVKTT